MSLNRRAPEGASVVGACLVAAGVFAWGSPARAEQVVVFDQTWEHTPDLPDSHFRLPPDVGTPENWVSPVDYSQGSAWVYLEVHTKPTAQETKFQVCFEASPTYACTYQSPTYTEVGTYEWETPFADFWSPPGEFVDWTQGTNNIACILKDTENGKPSADNVGPEVAALYTPTEVRLVVTLVEPGSAYEPPTPTGAGTGSSTGGDDGSSSGDAPADSSGGPVDPSTSSGGGDGATADDGPATTAGTGSTGPAGGSDTSGGAPADDDDGGCACRSDGGSGGSWFVLVPVVLGLRRRIRARR